MCLAWSFCWIVCDWVIDVAVVFLRRLLIYLCEPGCLKDCVPGLKVLLDYVWTDDWGIGMNFYFCRTPPFVWHSLLRRLAKTGRLHFLGLFDWSILWTFEGSYRGLFWQVLFCFPFTQFTCVWVGLIGMAFLFCWALPFLSLRSLFCKLAEARCCSCFSKM